MLVLYPHANKARHRATTHVVRHNPISHGRAVPPYRKHPPPPHTHTDHGRRYYLSNMWLSQKSGSWLLQIYTCTRCNMDNGSWKHTCEGFTIIILLSIKVHDCTSTHKEKIWELNAQTLKHSRTNSTMPGFQKHNQYAYYTSTSSTTLSHPMCSVTQLLSYSVTQPME